MTGRSENDDLKRADIESIIFLEIVMGKGSRSLFREKNRRTCLRCQFSVTSNEISMRMSQKNPFQGQIILREIAQIAIHTPFRIDDNGFTLRSNDIRRLRQPGNKKSFNMHRWPFLGWSVLPGQCPTTNHLSVNP